MNATAVAPHLGFLTVLQEGGGFLGGYLVTNLWGRPLEFRLSTAVQPNRVQQILYGPTLNVYLSAELIGKTLIEKTHTPVQLVITDVRDVLELRRSVEYAVVWVASTDDPAAIALIEAGSAVRTGTVDRTAVLAHPDFVVDVPFVADVLNRAGAGLDAAEPFVRIREAIAEARKMGVTQRAAG